jgi:hypothetical protein
MPINKSTGKKKMQGESPGSMTWRTSFGRDRQAGCSDAQFIYILLEQCLCNQRSRRIFLDICCPTLLLATPAIHFKSYHRDPFLAMTKDIYGIDIRRVDFAEDGVPRSPLAPTLPGVPAASGGGGAGGPPGWLLQTPDLFNDGPFREDQWMRHHSWLRHLPEPRRFCLVFLGLLPVVGRDRSFCARAPRMYAAFATGGAPPRSVHHAPHTHHAGYRHQAPSSWSPP